MDITIVKVNNTDIAVIRSDEMVITDVQSALDLMATIRYESGCNHIAINKEAITEDFFRLSTKLAGDILQKFINYQVKLAIVGDFSAYTSRSLKDFIYESNSGKHIFFLPDEQQAIEALSKV